MRLGHSHSVTGYLTEQSPTPDGYVARISRIISLAGIRLAAEAIH
jgi:hypothetical protein